MTLPTENQGEIRVPLSHEDMKSSRHFAVDPPEWLFHYTSLSNAGEILQSKSLWLTKIQNLNDTSELKIAFDLFKRAVERRSEQIADKEKSDFLLRASHQMDSFKQTNICVASFCESGDLLSQWRAYGNNGSGVALGFSGKRVKELQNRGFLNIWKCVYRPDIQEQVANDLVEMLENTFDVCIKHVNPDNWERTKEDLIGYFNTTFLRVAPVFKNEHFAEEKEWRLVAISRKNTDENYKTIMSKERVSQFYVVDFKRSEGRGHDFIGTMTIGPTANPEQIRNTFQTFSSQNDFGHVLLERSKIPFRG